MFLERTGRTKVEDDFGLEVRKLYRWTRPCFSGPTIDARTHDVCTDPAAACPDGTPVPVFQVTLSTPQLNKT
jgi:hypothetical protein